MTPSGTVGGRPSEELCDPERLAGGLSGSSLLAEELALEMIPVAGVESMGVSEGLLWGDGEGDWGREGGLVMGEQDFSPGD